MALKLPDFLHPYETQIRAKIPVGWEEKPNKNGDGWIWYDPSLPDKRRVRIDDANPKGSYVQQVAHVRVNTENGIVTINGTLIPSGKLPEAHIPLSEYIYWSTWYEP